MIGIKMKPKYLFTIKRGNTLQKGNPPLPTYNPPNFYFFIFYFYFICTKISVTRKHYIPLIIFTNLANIFAYITIIVRRQLKYV